MSNNDNDTTMDIRGLDKVLKALKSKRPPVVRVGVLGNAAAQPHPGADGLYGNKIPTNAQVGAWHEFGTTKMPIRSFLRMPLTALLEKRLAQSGSFTRDALQRVLSEGTLEPWCEKMGVVAVAIVNEAFQTEGFGIWPKSDMRRKKTKVTLTETTQLRNSITYEVKS